MSDDFQSLVGRFQRIAGRHDVTPEAIRLAQAAGGRLVLQSIREGRLSLSKFAKQEFRSQAPFLPAAGEYLREHQLAFLWQLALADVLPEDEQHLSDLADLHDVAEQNAAAAARLAATAASTDQGQALVPMPPELRKWIKDLPPDNKPGLRRAYRREHVWLSWQTSEGMGAAAIRDRWNGLDVAVRQAIAPRCFDAFGTDKPSGANRVKQALVRARRENKTSKPKRTAKTPRRTTSKARMRKT